MEYDETKRESFIRMVRTMKKMPSVRSVHYGYWVLAAAAVSIILFFVLGKPVVLLFITAGLMVGAALVIGVEMSSRQNHYSNGLAAEIPFDPETQEAVIRSSICTGEKVAGFKGKTDGHFTEVMVIHTPQEEERFREIYGLEKVKREY